MRNRTRLWAVLALGFASLILLRDTDPLRVLPLPAQRFVAYYQAFGAADAKVGPWQRLLFSFAMASSSPRPKAS